MEIEKNKVVVILILNIPRSFGSGDLRRFFTSFVESERFKYFHYKRRPLQKLQPSILKSIKDVDNKQLPTSLSDGESLTNCCLIKISDDDFDDFVSLYENKNWFGRKEVENDTLCYFSRINSMLCDSELEGLMEFRPPKLMPRGNVGTTTKFFLDAINSCQMPSSLIKKLDLDFPQSRSRRYGNVPPPIGIEKPGQSNQSEKLPSTSSAKKLVTVTGTIEANFIKHQNDVDFRKLPKDNPISSSKNENDEYANLGEEWERHQALNDDPHSARRQLFNPDDYQYQPGTKERLFEEEQEVTWDKGSSGLVFYTDAQYWHAQKADEERNCDDWDVDMSIYYKDARPDLDSAQIRDMKDEANARLGISKSKSVFKKRLPKTFIRNELALKNISSKKDNLSTSSSVPFPIFVKERGIEEVGETSKKKIAKEKNPFTGNNFSQKIMKKHGWSQGQGLGANNEGIAKALDGEIDGQIHRGGLGYKKTL